MRRILSLAIVLLAAGIVPADDAPEADRVPAAAEGQERADQQPADRPGAEKPGAEKDAKHISGMSILGNQEAPKSLVIVPWKSSVIGDSLGIAPMLDDSRLPVDKEVFMRALSYYEIRSRARP